MSKTSGNNSGDNGVAGAASVLAAATRDRDEADVAGSVDVMVRRIVEGWIELDAACEYRHLPPSRMAEMIRREIDAWMRQQGGTP